MNDENKTAHVASDDWKKNLKCNQVGNIMSTISNGLLVLAHSKFVANKLAYNEFSESVYIIAKVGWDKKAAYPRSFTDYDRKNIKMILEEEGIYASSNYVDDVVEIYARKHSYNPVKNMLNGFEYKGEGYIRKLLVDYLGAENEDYNYEVMKLVMVAAVKRIYEPGCKYDYCVVLQGPQGIGKSTFIMKLAMKPEWYSDSISALGKGREAAEQLLKKWIVEIGELSAFKKSENESIKSFFSAQQDTFREAYGHYAKDHPRTCVFFGTTNDSEYLHDDTGNRRILPIITGVYEATKSLFDEECVKEDFESAWAEAHNIYLSSVEEGKNIALVLPEKVRSKAIELQTIANEEDSWKGATKEYLVDLIKSEARRVYDQEAIVVCKTSALDIWVNALGGTKASCTKAIATRINAIMRFYKTWEYKTTVRFDNYQGRGYELRFVKGDLNHIIEKFINDVS